MKKRTIWIGIGALALAVAGGSAFFSTRPKDVVKWRKIKVDRGNVTQTISSTGTMNPLVQVPVGTQVSGVISSLYADYNSLVKKGQLIAQIDPTLNDIQVHDARAALAKSQTTVADAKRQYDRAKRMASEKLISDQDLEAKEIAFKNAVESEKSAKASLDRALANRKYCDITAPVDGVIISRLADVGQTVAASFSTPNLFQIARDLAKMKVEISIDEADIDEIKTGQKCKFTVDSLPERQFEAVVSQVRLEPITNSNVVTYKVVIEVENELLEAEAQGEKAEKTDKPDHGKPFDHKGGQGDKPMHSGPPQGMPGGFPGGHGGPGGPGAAAPANFPGHGKEFRGEHGGKHRGPRGEGAAMPNLKLKLAAKPQKAMSREEAARTPGGIAFLGGPVFDGNLALRPGMTANVTIQTKQKIDVLKVPNAALRFNPKLFLKEDAKKMNIGQAMMGGGPPPGMFGRPHGGGQKGTKKGIVARREDRLWVLVDGMPKAISVRSGISDGMFTEVSGEELKEGMEIITGVEGDVKKPGAGMPPGGPR